MSLILVARIGRIPHCASAVFYGIRAAEDSVPAGTGSFCSHAPRLARTIRLFGVQTKARVSVRKSSGSFWGTCNGSAAFSSDSRDSTFIEDIARESKPSDFTRGRVRRPLRAGNKFRRSVTARRKIEFFLEISGNRW